MRKLKQLVTVILLLCFTPLTVYQPVGILAADNTGTIKIFSELKGIEIYVDEKLIGTDMADIPNIQAGQHYIKVMKSGNVIYSELVSVTAGAVSAVLIKGAVQAQPQVQPQMQQSVSDSLYKEGQQYKQEKIDILLSKSYETVGKSYTDSMYFPGYYSMMGSEWTTSKSTATEITDWKIIKGGVQQISDSQFAQLVGDKDTIARMDKDMEDYNNNTTIGAITALVGIVMVLVGGSMAFSSDTAATETGAVLFAVGCLPTIIGWSLLSKDPPYGHYITPGTAAKQAFDYNQALKKKLGLPENYEPK